MSVFVAMCGDSYALRGHLSGLSVLRAARPRLKFLADLISGRGEIALLAATQPPAGEVVAGAAEAIRPNSSHSTDSEFRAATMAGCVVVVGVLYG
jgi:hypothetical protein